MRDVGQYQDCMTMQESSDYLAFPYSTFLQKYKIWGIEPLRIAGQLWFQKGELDRWQREEVARRAQQHRVGAGMARRA